MRISNLWPRGNENDSEIWPILNKIYSFTLALDTFEVEKLVYEFGELNGKVVDIPGANISIRTSDRWTYIRFEEDDSLLISFKNQEDRLMFQMKYG